MKKIVSVAVAATALVAGTSFPAAATPVAWSGDIEFIGTDSDFTYWDIDEGGSISHSGIVHDANADGYADEGDYEFDRVWCGDSGGLLLDDNYLGNEDLVRDVDTNGDTVISGTGTFGDLDATVEYRLYAEGDFLRTSYVVTNNTGSAITVDVSTYDDSSDNAGEGTTSSGDAAIDNTDLWWTQYDTDFDSSNWLGDADSAPSVVFGRYYGSPNLIEPDFTDFDPFNDESDYVYFGEKTIQPGESFQWIFFYQMLSFDASAGADSITHVANQGVIDSAAAASDGAADEFGADLVLSGRLARGLDAGIDANWVIETELAETGTDASGIALAGAALVAAGFAVAVRRRRASR